MNKTELLALAGELTLRDFFAAHIAGALANVHHGNDWATSGKGHAPAVAAKAYHIADALMAERAKAGAQ